MCHIQAFENHFDSHPSTKKLPAHNLSYFQTYQLFLLGGISNAFRPSQKDRVDPALVACYPLTIASMRDLFQLSGCTCPPSWKLKRIFVWQSITHNCPKFHMEMLVTWCKNANRKCILKWFIFHCCGCLRSGLIVTGNANQKWLVTYRYGVHKGV